ncbi:alpha/beta hydrolase [Brevibacillus sp. SYP-B805]|uniref:alpha/beta hydrolase n=1 Tax=Brevibacillus sp. SYP-B805 TaxID=1578199 RepID=UPI0013EB567B|nr:alpha/beta hydrolase [Brevibacillus sp. SYP-B805]NGQ93651.1 alpha/beta hydrolase [Brevibacillus sp. SYP-B805]
MEKQAHVWHSSAGIGAVVIVHGTGEHHGRYEHVARFLNDRGFHVWAGDLPGWGRSAGLKGHIESFDDYLPPVAAWIAAARRELPEGSPVFLLGHSMGGLVAVRFVQRFQGEGLDGLVLSSPCLRLKMAVPRWKTELAVLLDRLWPRLQMANGIAPEMVTRDAMMQERYGADPYVYRKVSVRWYNGLMKAMEQAWQEMQNIRIPLLVLQAGDDQLIDPAGVARFVEELSLPDKTYIEYPGLYHEVFNEPERERVLADLAAWLEKHGP